MSNAWADFIRQDLPTRKNEYWKYAELAFLQDKKYSPANRVASHLFREIIEKKRLPDSFLLVCLNGCPVAELSDPLPAMDGFVAGNVSHHDEQADTKRYPFAQLNNKLAETQWLLSLSGEIRKPIHLLFLAVSDNEWLAHARFTIRLAQQASVTIFEEHLALTTEAYFMNQVMQVHLEESAKLAWFKLQNNNMQAMHVACTAIQQKKDSNLAWVNVAIGSTLARDDVIVQLQAAGASCQTSGFYRLTDDHQYIDHHVDIQHRAAHTQSDMLFKGTAAKRSRAVFNGRLLVEKNAQSIVAFQGNHHLLLSRQAQMYAKPELEVYADDVKCKHGATTGQMDEDGLFYLRSRGIAHDEAVNMVLQGFAADVTERITHDAIRQRIGEALWKT